jgi:hypothetical protein
MVSAVIRCARGVASVLHQCVLLTRIAEPRSSSIGTSSTGIEREVLSMSGIQNVFLRGGRLAGNLAFCAALGGFGCGQPAAAPPPDFNVSPFMPGGPDQDPEEEPNTPVEPVPRSTDTGLSPPGSPLAECGTPGPQLLRRLTSAQYSRTLTSLFGEGVPEQGVLTDSATNGFKVDADTLVVQNLDTELLMGYAETVAAWAKDNGRLLPLANGCTNAADAGCRRTFITSLGLRAYREELSETAIASFDALFQEYADGDFAAGAETVAIAMLQSPNLLYRREIGAPAPGGEFQLTPFEVASQLSYLLTDGPPDALLLEAARSGALSTPAQLDAHAERLLATEAGQRTLEHFIEGWVDIEGLPQKAKDDNTYNLSAAERDAMGEETRRLFADAFTSGAGIERLFTADYTFVNQTLGGFYGMTGVSGEAFQRVALPPNRPPGILGHASYLTAHAQPENSSPVQRAFIVRERILCQDLPPVPVNLDTNLDAPGNFTTNRERYTEHSSNEVCYACHVRMDPIGFAFENFDGFGRYREQENGAPIDASGELSSVPGGPIPLDGVESLSAYLATSELVQTCLVRFWTYYAYGRDTWQGKQCNHDAVRREAAAGNYSLKSVLAGIIHAPHFSRRVQEP